MRSEPSILVVEDDARIAYAIRTILVRGGFPEPTVASDGARARVYIKEAIPDVVLLDLGLPDDDGVEILRSVRAAGFANPILVVTAIATEDRLLAALGARADGCIDKEDLDARLPIAIKDLMKGGVPLSPLVAKAVLTRLNLYRRPVLLPSLTAREKSVLQTLATGLEYSEIGKELGIELNTVRTHIRAVYDKLGVKNAAEAVYLACHWGILDLSTT